MIKIKDLIKETEQNFYFSNGFLFMGQKDKNRREV